MAEEGTQSTRQSPSKKPRRALLGKKLGTTQIFTEAGRWVPVTVLQVGPCTVLQVKTPDKDGYSAVQLGFDETRKPRRKPQQAIFESLGTKPLRWVKEVPFVDEKAVLEAEAKPESGPSRASGDKGGETVEAEQDKKAGAKGSKDEAAATETKAPTETKIVPGARVGVVAFKGVQRVDVGGVSKGRGFAGVIRRHHFSAGPKSHGTKNIREPGSTGMHTDPARVIPGKKMPGHLGAVKCKVRNLEVVRIEEGDNLLLVKGAVPGPRGGYVYIEESLV